MKTWILLLGLFASLLPLARGADADDIRAIFSAYKKAILEKQGDVAADQVTAGTLAAYDQIVEQARKADRATLEQLPMIDRMQVIFLRHRVPADELRQFDGRGAFVYAVNHDWIGKSSVRGTDIGEVAVDGERASASMLTEGQPVPTRFDFLKEKGQWRLDVATIMRGTSSGLEEVARQRGVSENELILSLAEAISGEKPTDRVWEPVK